MLVNSKGQYFAWGATTMCRGAHQFKLFARGVGNVKVTFAGADQTQEILELTQVVHLSPEQSAAARAHALEEEQHAYQVSKDVYGQTPPSQ